MKKYILSIDQGTTGSTAILMGTDGLIASQASVEYEQIYPKPGWVEHNAYHIWESVEKAAIAALTQVKAHPEDIVAIGITNQRETVMAWEKSTGRLLHNAIVWQCRRTTSMCAGLRKKWAVKIKNKTGLILDPYFSGSKIRWLIENVKEVKDAQKRNNICFGTVDTFLMWKLSNGKIFSTDVSNASRTMLMNIKTDNWDDELLKLFKVKRENLPEIKSSSGIFGKSAELSFLPAQVPISGVAGDQQAALFGQTCFSAGDAKCTFGTGSFILMNTGDKILKSKSGLLTTVAWKLGNNKTQYALEGGAFICGAAVAWLRDGLKLFTKSSDIEKLALQVNDTNGVEFVPALTGLGAPYWKPEARGEITGLTRGITNSHIARATLEALALQNSDILLAMQKDLKRKIRTLKVDGGASANNLLMQLQSNYLDTKVVRPQQIETTAIGAAYLAGLGIGIWKDLKEIQKIWKIDETFTPKLSKKQILERQKKWIKAVKKASMV